MRLFKITAVAYVWSGHTAEAEEITMELQEQEGTDVRVRQNQRARIVLSEK